MLEEADWRAEVLPRVRGIASTLASEPHWSAESEAFLAWPLNPGAVNDEPVSAVLQANVFAYPPDAPTVQIRLGSIHSVKGETHTATLVLDSFFRRHHLSELKPWLLGDRNGGSRTGARGNVIPEGPVMLGRLKLHYVAMTRPTHLLCLAMRKDAFSAPELERLALQGWNIVDCSDEVVEEG